MPIDGFSVSDDLTNEYGVCANIGFYFSLELYDAVFAEIYVLMFENVRRSIRRLRIHISDGSIRRVGDRFSFINGPQFVFRVLSN